MTRDELLKFIVERFELEDDEVDHHTSLFDGGLLDSFQLLEFVQHLETSAGIKVSPLEMTLENFDTVERMLRYLGSRRG